MPTAADQVERAIMIANELGLHARAATKFVQIAGKFPCDVTVEKDGHEVNGKSIMGVLMLVASKGSVVTIRTRVPAHRRWRSASINWASVSMPSSMSPW